MMKEWATVIHRHRKGFRVFWTWKVRGGQPGRPSVSQEARNQIRQMSRENPLWAAPRIHGELLKLGIDIGETSVGKYLARGRKPPSQTWRTFLENHFESIGRLLHGADHSFSSAVRIPDSGSRPSPDSTFRRDPSSNRGMDRAATAGGISLGHRDAFLVERPRPNLRF